jgi:hypothetical protein
MGSAIGTAINWRISQKENNMYVYIKSEPGLWTVGFYDPSGKWHPDSDHASTEDAANRVHYLNGGEPEKTTFEKGDE